MSLQGYIFLENENYLKIKKRNVLNYNDIFIIYKNFYTTSLLCFLKIYSYRNVLEIICCYKSYLY